MQNTRKATKNIVIFAVWCIGKIEEEKLQKKRKVKEPILYNPKAFSKKSH